MREKRWRGEREEGERGKREEGEEARVGGEREGEGGEDITALIGCRVGRATIRHASTNLSSTCCNLTCSNRNDTDCLSWSTKVTLKWRGWGREWCARRPSFLLGGGSYSASEDVKMKLKRKHAVGPMA